MIEIKRRQISNASQLSNNIHPLLRRLYASRGIKTEQELELSTKALLNFDQLYGIEQAVNVLITALKAKQKIVVVGDFDADGATSTALSIRAFRMLGFSDVDYFVPDRVADGYGLSPQVVEKVKLMDAKLIMTVDNGISSIQGVQAAKEHGIKVVVTDHHLPGTQLPQADAIINPNLTSCQFASKSLAGVGVAFYLMLALRQALREQNWFSQQLIPEPNLALLLDLVALGTVADVAVLDKNNRILVHQGLQRIRQGVCSAGIQALIEVAKRDRAKLVATDLGFALGPRLNAAGRLDKMAFGVELLLTDDPMLAKQMAEELDGLNEARKEIEHGMKEEAMAICERLKFNAGELPYALSLYQQEWHQGVIGIVASRIKEQFHRPVAAFADDNHELIKGSCRSIEGLHIKDALANIDKKYPELIKKFGGHAMAAGLTIAKKDFAQFSQAFTQEVEHLIEKDALTGVTLTDGELESQEFSIETAELLRFSGPWGQGFAEPVFDGRFRLLRQRLLKEKHLKMALEPLFADGTSGFSLDAIAFNVDLKRFPDPSVKEIELVYRLDINEYRGNKSLQLMALHINAIS